MINLDRRALATRKCLSKCLPKPVCHNNPSGRFRADRVMTAVKVSLHRQSYLRSHCGSETRNRDIRKRTLPSSITEVFQTYPHSEDGSYNWETPNYALRRSCFRQNTRTNK